MNCPECEELLQRHLDGDRAADRAELDRHLAGCAECRERYAAAARLSKGLELLARPSPPADLAQRVTARVLRDRAARLSRRRLWAGLAVAAGLLLAALAGYHWLTPGEPESGSLAAAALRAAEPPPDNAPSLRQGVRGVREALALVMGRLADGLRAEGGLFEVSTAPLQFVSTDALPPMGPMAQPLGPAAEGLRRTGEGVSTGMEVVGGQTRRALNYFVRKMPPLASGS